MALEVTVDKPLVDALMSTISTVWMAVRIYVIVHVWKRMDVNVGEESVPSIVQMWIAAFAAASVYMTVLHDFHP